MLSRLPALAVLACAATLASAQMPQKFTRVYGPSDRDIPTPVHATNTGSDSSAVQAVIEFVKSTGVTGWQGAAATGTITFAGDNSPHPAIVNMLGSTGFRLDVTRDSGVESTVLSGRQGVFLAANGKKSFLSPDVAVIGIFAYPRLLSSSYPLPTTILTDRGTTTVRGLQLHRITLDDPSADGQGNAWKTEDLDFDPASGRLVESVAAVHLSSSDAALYTMETVYSDYRTVGLATLPYTYTQSLNGQLQWTLTLTGIDTTKIPDQKMFRY